MNPLTTLFSLALLAPATASAGAGPMVWWQVPEYRVNNVEDHASFTAKVDANYDDHAFAVDRRVLAVDSARNLLSDARDHRREMRKQRRYAKKNLRQMRRQDGRLAGVTTDLALAERSLMEARDHVDLHKAIVSTRNAHLDLERGRLARAKADRELTEALMLNVADAKGEAWHGTKRYRKQVLRMSNRTAELRSDWNLARVELQERRQDHWTGDEIYTMPVAFHVTPRVPFVSVDGPSDESTAQEGEMALRRVHFDINSARLDTEALNNLAWNAHVLRENRDATVRIEGHTDTSGPAALNRALAWDRAEAIEAFLTREGVWRSQLETAAYGESAPLADDPRLAVVNRRAELRVIEDPDGLVDGTIDNAWEDDFMFDLEIDLDTIR